MVDVSSQSNKVNITVSSSGVSSNVNASGDTSHYYSEKAREWAISNRIVDGVDYSSKYYAEKSNQSALTAQSFAQSAQDSYKQFQSSVDGALSNIDSSVQGAIDEINNTKTDIITDIEFVADGEKKEIEDLIDSGKDELKESIGDVKVLATLEIGDIGFTQMAIDESKGKRRVLNGQLIIQDQYAQFTNIIKNSVALNPDLACTESEWQTAVTMSANGVCYKFVIDDNAGTIRLPKYPTYLDLTNNTANTSAKTATVSVKGNGKTLGLTNGSVNIGMMGGTGGLITRDQAYGQTLPFHVTNSTSSITVGDALGFTTDASKSGLTGSVTIPAIAGVTSEKIKGQYFIQVATGAETEDNIINEIELNNPFSLLDYKYSEYELNNLSWLRSNGQWNAKSVYPAVYDLLLKIYNGTETKAGVSVKLSTETFTDYDFVLNTADETFRLPVKVKLASGKAVVGNGMTLGLMNNSSSSSGDPYGGLYMRSSAANFAFSAVKTTYGLPVGTEPTGTPNMTSTTFGVTTDPTKSGIETSDSDLYLYFYVGETVQNANLINAGRIEEKLVDKVDTNASNFTADGKSLISGWGMPSSKYIDLTLGASGSTYTAPANGYFSVSKTSGITNGYIQIANNNAHWITSISHCNIATDWVITWMPVKKGDVIMITYNVTGQTNGFNFIYAQGEV